jgi:Aminoglycoside-2''-adenylyltransferase
VTQLGEWSEAPEKARAWLRDARAPWWVAGGWALDLYLGRQTRDHVDLDVSCFRVDLGKLRAALGGWELHIASDGRLRELATEEEPRAGDHVLWCRPVGSPHWKLEIMLEERDGEDWVFRRNPAIRLPAEQLTLSTEDGTPFLRPEVQLLYKAREARQKDENDLTAVLPKLDRAGVEWLRRALMRAHPTHPWIVAIDRAV